MLGALLFVLGFTVVFLAVAVTVSAAGALLKEHQSLLMRLGGVIVILMAVVFLGVGGQRSVQPRWKPAATPGRAGHHGGCESTTAGCRSRAASSCWSSGFSS